MNQTPCLNNPYLATRYLMNKLLKLLAITLILTATSFLAHAQESDEESPAAPEPISNTGSTEGKNIPLDRIVVLVEEGLITQRELDQRLAQIKRSLIAKQVSMPSEESLISQVLDNLIQEQIQKQLATQLGIRIDDFSLDREMNTLAKSNGMSLLDFREQIIAEGLDYAAFREDVRLQLAIKQLRKRQVDNQVKVTDREVEDLIASQSQALNRDVEIRIRHILISIPEDASPDQIKTAREKATSILDRTRAGEDFAELAVSESDGRNALEGGDFGWRPAAQLPAVFMRDVTLLEPGDISDVIRSPSGFHLIMVEDKRGGQEAWIEQTRARHILIKTNALVNDAEAEIRLRSLKNRIEQGDSFATLARAYSEDKGSAVEGGDLGWATPGTFVPAFEETMNSLEKGIISEPFKSQFGWHILEVTDRRRQNSTMKVLKARAKQLIWERKREEELELWLRRIRDEAFVEYIDERYKPSEDS